jgi:hypothetical protein
METVDTIMWAQKNEVFNKNQAEAAGSRLQLLFFRMCGEVKR